MPAGDASSWAAYNMAATHVSRRQTVQPTRPRDATVYGQPGVFALNGGGVLTATVAGAALNLNGGGVLVASQQVVRP